MIKNLFKTKKAKVLFSVFVILVFFSKTVFAVWDGTFYDPGETLNPECLPTQTDCDVLSPLTSSTGVTVSQTVGQTIGATGSRLTKLWATDVTTTGLTVANSLTFTSTTSAVEFQNTFKLQQSSSTTVDMLDSGGNVILQFDEGA